MSSPIGAQTPASQPKSCNYAGGPACPAPPPVNGPWTYQVEPNYDGVFPSNLVHSFADVDYYYNMKFVYPNGGWCSTSDINQVEGYSGWGSGPTYQNGILVQDNYVFTYANVAYQNPPATPYSNCAQMWNDTAGVRIYRSSTCLYASSLNYQSSPAIGPYCSFPSNQSGWGKSLGCPSCSASPGPGNSGSNGAGNSGGADSGSGATVIGDPVDVSNGNAYYEELDYKGSGTNPLKFTRSANAIYSPVQHWNGGPNKFPIGAQYSGFAWSANYFQSLTPITITDSTGVPRSAVYAFRPDGRVLIFNLYSGVYSPDGDTADSLLQTGTGWTYQTANDAIETYNSAGQLLTVANRGEAPVTLAYAIAGDPPSSVSDAYGHTLTFHYIVDASNVERLGSMTDPNGSTIAYAYDSNGNPVSVTYQDGSVRQYAYSTGAFANSLATVTDESGNAFESWTYLTSDVQQRVGGSSFAGGVGANSFSYSTSGAGGTVSVTDPLGEVRTFSQQYIWGRYRMTSSNAVCPGCDSARTYDANANITSRTDFSGVQTTGSYDVTRNLETSRTEAYGTSAARTISTTWDSNWRQPNLITEPNRTTVFAYDSMGNVLTKVVTDTATLAARTWTYTYDSYGRLLTAKGPRTDLNSTTTYTYYTCTTGVQCGQLNTVTNAAGNVTTYSSYNAYGQPLTITDPNGVVTTLTYDARQRLTSRQIGSDTAGFSYFPTGLLKQVTLPDASYVKYTYDAAHRLTIITDSAGNYLSYTLDAMGNRTTEKAYDPTGTLHRTHARVYNTLDQLYQDVNAAGTSAVTTSYAYDGNGNQTTIHAPLSRNTTNGYDQLNRLNVLTDPAGGVTHFAYDGNDNLTSIQDPRSLTTANTYSGFGDAVQLASPDTGTSTNTYDSAGNLSVATDARGATASYSYEALNRVTQILYASGGVTDQTLVFGYDAGVNGKGHLTSAGDGNHTLSWTYDTLGRVIGKGQTVGTVAQSVGYGYTNGDLTAEVTPTGQAIAYTYNTNHHISGITVNGTAVVTGVTYEPFGAVNGWSWGNGATVARTFNGDGLISQLVSASVTYGYNFDNANRITGISDSSNSALSWTYGYDPLDRITSATTSVTTLGWTYDANGNRQSQTGSAPSTFSVSSGSNQLNGTTGTLTRTYDYNASGMTTNDGNNTFNYNNRGRMLGVTNTSGTTGYLYNVLGQLVEKVSTTPINLYVYDESGHILGEYDGGGNLIEETVWLGDIPVATIRPDPIGGVDIYYVHSDHLNSAKRITRPTDNALLWRIDQDPFGTAQPNQNPAGIGTFVYNLRFQGQLYLAETGLNYNYNRDYDPATGRYIESDPLGLQAGVNTYAYVGSRPTLLSDPSGLMGFGGGGSAGAASHAIPRSMGPPPATYYGGEFYFFAGGGLTSVTCKNECGVPKTFRYIKVCPLGAAVGGSGGAGLVTGMTGKACDPGNYAGWFFETGGSFGPISIGADFGYNSGGSLSGVNEGSAGIGFGAKFKAIWCYYIPIG